MTAAQKLLVAIADVERHKNRCVRAGYELNRDSFFAPEPEIAITIVEGFELAQSKYHEASMELAEERSSTTEKKEQ